MNNNNKLFSSPYQYDHVVQDEATTLSRAAPARSTSTTTNNNNLLVAGLPNKGRRNLKLSFLAGLAVMVVIATMGFVTTKSNDDDPFTSANSAATVGKMRLATTKLLEGSSSSSTLKGENNPNKVTMPAGVNFGSWLSLEDYFFVGDTGAVEVATPDANKAAVCLPPLHLGQGPIWQSETDLLGSLIRDVGVPRALKIFHAHRTSFVTESDILKLSSWGIPHVRIPLSWCLTDHKFEDIIQLDNSTHAYQRQLLEQYTCEDPYYDGVRWPAVPKHLITNILRICARHGITASLDLHTYPGATSPGTFSGLWPKQPKFWYHDNPEDPQNDLGRTLYRTFIQWIESLAVEDPTAFEGILGISPMNEPAHLAGVFRKIPGRNYLPPLPTDLAHEYLVDRLGNHPDLVDGPHVRVLLWLQDAIDFFQQSTLPKLGKQLHMNIHESALSIPIPDDVEPDPGVAINFIAAWWSRATTQEERSTWAVLDVHHYDAWSPECQGASDGPPSGNYTCTDFAARTETMNRCSSWATKTYRKHINQHCESTAQLMTGEFSTSTHHSVRHACNDLGTLQASYKTQIEAAEEGNVKLYYWSYKMPHGGAFRNAWSFSHLMYLFGINPHPDVSNYNCGGRFHHADEVNDDWFG